MLRYVIIIDKKKSNYQINDNYVRLLITILSIHVLFLSPTVLLSTLSMYVHCTKYTLQ